jgi:uncharacterized membrane protein YkvA (DUF1232 family)
MPSSFEKHFSQDEIARMRQIARDEEGLGHSLFETLRRVARSLPFSVDVLAAWYCTCDPATPTRVRLILLSALAYFVLPFDSIPDLLPVLGFTDDAAVIAAAIASVASHLRPEHREQARKTLEGERFE